jgi:hypothetical protein
MRGGDETDAPPGGWLVVACFHTLWSSTSSKIMPSIAELAPLYQDVALFLSVRADSVELAPVSKSLKVKRFPTFVMLRGGVELQRIEGGERIVEKIVAFLAKNVTSADKAAHAHRRHRLRVERAQELGIALNAEEDASDERPQLDWTWDPEQCGESVNIVWDGLQVILAEKEDEGAEKGVWEWSKSEYNWTPFSEKLNKRLESDYVSGSLYSRCYFSDEGADMWLNDVKISSYEVTGFYGSFEEANDYQNVNVRRRGDRLSVPNEEPYLSNEQKKRDKALAQYREQRIAYQKQMQIEKWGKDVEAVRGTIGIMQNTGAPPFAPNATNCW